MQFKPTRVADFFDASRWVPVASGEARLELSSESCPDGKALCMAFDFRGGGGFVVARREIAMPLPDAYAFLFRVRGSAPSNTLEFKLVDPSGKNVWRWQENDFAFSSEGRRMRLRSSQIAFAWGPAGGGTIREVSAIEFVISAGKGGQGVVWIEDFCFEDRTIKDPPIVSASSSAAGTAPHQVLDTDEATAWWSVPDEPEPWLQLDFHAPREYGGLVVEWDGEPITRRYRLEATDHLGSWRILFQACNDCRKRSYIPLPAGESRYLRISFASRVGIRRIEVQPLAFAQTPVDFFHSLAAEAPRGRYPRYFCREQTYWTCAGLLDGETCALINEEGMIEPDKGSFSIEPWLEADGAVITWADVETSVRLEPGGLPIPTVLWQHERCSVEITCYAVRSGNDAVLLVRYRVGNLSPGEQILRLNAVIRPFQVSPPWQTWQGLGGLSAIKELSFQKTSACVNGTKTVLALQPPSACGATSFEQGDISDYLVEGRLPLNTEARDENGYASGAMQFKMIMHPGEKREIYLAIPFGEAIDEKRLLALRGLDGATEFRRAAATMEACLGAVELRMPEGAARDAAETFRTAAGHILINRRGSAIQPGPRRYTRAWIRDGVIMGAALHRMGEHGALRAFLEWYAPYQREDGFVPCCVDSSGADWLVEHDSHGQLIYGVRESFRFTRDQGFLAAMWPHVRLAALHIQMLRKERMTAEYQQAEQRARYGLLPESASHEGYLAHPVHSYWDDFWALRGLKDAAALAGELGYEAESRAFTSEAESLRSALLDSMAAVIAAKNLQYLPGSVEWADFDPTATSNAVALLQSLKDLPKKQLGLMFDHFIRDFRKKRSGEMEWTNYTAYEIRIIGALIRLGKRREALELLAFFLRDRRPLAWNQWPEITWKDPRSPGHLGDLPHTWIASEWMLAFASLFAYEDESADALVLGAGIDEAWLDEEGFSVKRLPTWFGPLDFSMRREPSGALHVKIAGDLRKPRGGFILRPPGEGSIYALEVNGAVRHDFSRGEVYLTECPSYAVLFRDENAV